MAIPSGSGTEVLKRATFNALSANTAHTILTVGANKICTILSISIANCGGTGTARISVSPLGSGDCFLMINQPFPNPGTFVWSDKFVMTATDVLKVETSCADFDVYCSYIEQDFGS